MVPLLIDEKINYKDKRNNAEEEGMKFTHHVDRVFLVNIPVIDIMYHHIS